MASIDPSGNINASQQIHNNRLSYVGASFHSPHNSLNYNTNLSNQTNQSANIYGTMYNTTDINSDPNRTLSKQHGTHGIETVRPTALVSSYISSLNNTVSYFYILYYIRNLSTTKYLKTKYILNESLYISLQSRPSSSSTPSSTNGNMLCLPEEPELVKFGEDHKGLSPTNNSILNRSGKSEGHETFKIPSTLNNENGARIKLITDKSLSDLSAQFSSSPSPPTITASSASSQVSSTGNSIMKSKPPTGKKDII